MTDFSKTTIHCSSIGNIMSNGRSKKSPAEIWQYYLGKYTEAQNKFLLMDEKKKNQSIGLKLFDSITKYSLKVKEWDAKKDDIILSVGAMSHLKKVYGYAKYGKWSAAADKGTKEIKKGVIAEQESINLVCRLENKNLSKNEERISNDFLTGIPDVFIGESIKKAQYIIDIKTSWDIETFLNVLGKPLNEHYWWQIQGYMAITGAKLGEVSYCLVDTPESLLNNERYRLKERLDSVTDEDPIFKQAEKQLINNMTFGDIPEKERRIQFIVERDDESIEKVYQKVKKCREYLSEVEVLHLQGSFLAKQPSNESENEENLGENE